MSKRDLHKDDLGSVIFHCNKQNMSECLENQLFGLPARLCSSNLTKKITPGMTLFLFNKTDREMLGIFEAVSKCKISLHPPQEYQVKVSERLACPPLKEDQLKPIIEDNYCDSKFSCELDHQQTAGLISMFSDMAAAVIEEKYRESSYRNFMCNNNAINVQMLDGLKEVYEQITRLKREEKKLHALLECKDTMMTEPEVQDDPPLHIKDSIFLVGGYDGSSWLSTLDMYTPSQDAMNSLKPMRSAHSHTAVAKLSDELYVFGGGDDSVGYDTVESYNLLNKEWHPRPSLNEEKHHLAGAVVDNKIFALGGCKAKEILSCVEMYDSSAEKWIPTSPMLQKRSSLAAAELNGVLYAVGGIGSSGSYLQSAERFDTREKWTELKGMNTPRACHSLIVQNDKLFALGGYDGTNLLASVEIYDPRLGRWVIGEPMNAARGHAAAAVMENRIYAIGGITRSVEIEITATVEHYAEGQGWKLSRNLRGPGKRCCAGAVVFNS